jgi:ankyrin repeat protein
MVSNTTRRRNTLAAVAATAAAAAAAAAAKAVAESTPITQFYPVFDFLSDIETINYILALLSNKVLRPKLHVLGITLFKMHAWETLHRAVSAFMSLIYHSDISFNRYGKSFNASDMILRNATTKLPNRIPIENTDTNIQQRSSIIMESITKYMVKEKNINPIDRTNKTIVALKILVNCGADVNGHCCNDKLSTVHREWTPLVYAAYLGNIDIVKYLVRHGANVNPDHMWTPLMYAAKHGDYDMVKYLVDNGANVNANATYYGGTVLQMALESKQEHAVIHNMVKYLVDKGVNMNAAGDRVPPWMYAIKFGSIDILKFLVDNGANVKVANVNAAYFCSTFAVVHSNDNLEMIKYLVSIGAAFNIKRALTCAASYGYLKLIKYLVNMENEILNRPTEIPIYDDDDSEIEYRRDEYACTYGEYALLTAAEKGHQDVVEYLIGQSVNINARDYDGMTSLSLAVIERHRGIAEYLLNKGALQVSDTVLETPLVYAIMSKNLDMVQLLIENGAEMNHCTVKGYTIYVLALNNSLPIFEYLKQKGMTKEGYFNKNPSYHWG